MNIAALPRLADANRLDLVRSSIAQAILLLIVAFVTRGALFGDPVIHSDEQFYLLVGDRMLHGAWPYVDIFDRKPVGLFLIFAAIRSVTGEEVETGIVAYQVAATLAAVATAFTITRIAGRFASPVAALGAAVLYLVWLMIFDGAGGQSAVWYNLPMAAAALWTLDGMSDPRRLRLRGAMTMLLVGIAMQIKYTAMFEGMFFGLTFIHLRRCTGRRPASLAIDIICWAGAALLPTACAWGVYIASGHGDAFVFANFISIFGQRDDDTAASNLLKLAEAVGLAAPLLWLAWRGRAGNGFALAWLVAAAVALAIMHTFEQLYFLPFMLPLSVAAARGLDTAGAGIDRRRFVVILSLGLAAAAILTGMRIHRRGTGAQIREMVRLIGDRPAGCLFTYGSEPILYYLTRSCLPTRYIFRSHLGQSIEALGIGTDPVAETRRLLAQRPGVIVIRARKPTTNPATETLVLRAVADRYRLVGSVRVGSLRQYVYRLR